jgi:hypothetical protein
VRKKKTRVSSQAAVGPWDIHFFRRHRDDDAREAVPARDYLEDCPVAGRLLAAVTAVAEAPPPTFSGGGKWEAMHGEMAGIYEGRVDGPQRRHYRLFCLLERNGAEVGLGQPTLVILDGMDKPFRTTFTKSDYAKVRALADEYLARKPRSVAD